MVPDSKSALSDRFSLLAAPGYFVAALLVITPLGDFLSGVWPWRPAAVDWRFASIGLLSGFLLTPLLGVLIAVSVAALQGSQRLLRVLGLATLIGGVLCTLILGAFILDAVQLNSRIPAPQHRAFLDASIKAFFKYSLACGASYVLGVRAYRMGAWRAPRSATPSRERIVIGVGARPGEKAAS